MYLHRKCMSTCVLVLSNILVSWSFLFSEFTNVNSTTKVMAIKGPILYFDRNVGL